MRVLLRRDSQGVVAFEYDCLASAFGQFAELGIDAVARDLDRTLGEVLESAAG